MILLFDMVSPPNHFVMLYVLLAMIVAILAVGGLDSAFGDDVEIYDNGWKALGYHAFYCFALMFVAGVVLALAYGGSWLLINFPYYFSSPPACALGE